MKPIVGFLALALLASNAQAAEHCTRLVATGSPDAPPFLWRDPNDPERLIGASADVLAEIGSQIGVRIDMRYGGRRSEALAQVRSGRMDLLADQPLMDAELEHLDYVYPALAQNDYLVWAKAGSGEPLERLADLTGKPGALSARARMTPDFLAFAQASLSLERPQNLTRTFERLASGQVEYILAPRYAGQAVVNARGLEAGVQARPLVVDRPGLHLALGHDSSCNDAWLRGQLAKKMAELTASGRLPGILQSNVQRWAAQQKASQSSSR